MSQAISHKKSQIKVLIVDDSALMRLLVKSIIEKDPEIVVVGQASDGLSAVAMTKKHQPDVILMDIIMGDYDGLYGIQEIMRDMPSPIIVLSAKGNTNKGSILEALSSGAVDYINKPIKNAVGMHDIATELIHKIKVASSNKLPTTIPARTNTLPHTFSDNLPYNIVLIGASTGGPSAIEHILRNIPSNWSIPIIITQHMPDNFIHLFAKRLDTLTSIPVKVAKEYEEVLQQGIIYLIQGKSNSTLTRDTSGTIYIRHTDQQFEAYNSPSIDAIMLSAAAIYKEKAIGVLLSGMGRDGAAGLAKIYKNGGYTITQSRDTCVIYGMPKVANEMGVVCKIVPLKDIGNFLVGCLT